MVVVAERNHSTMLDAQLEEAVSSAALMGTRKSTPVMEAILSLLATDGVSH